VLVVVVFIDRLVRYRLVLTPDVQTKYYFYHYYYRLLACSETESAAPILNDSNDDPNKD
jgi:hypothetical protein